jgi:hypothetical protein
MRLLEGVGNQLIPDTAIDGSIGGKMRMWRISSGAESAVLVPSPYAYQKARWLVPARCP